MLLIKWSQMPQKSCGVYCAAINCHNARGNDKLSMFRFTKEKERCRKWVQNSWQDDLRAVPIQKLCDYQLCSKHFEDSQFMNKETKKINSFGMQYQHCLIFQISHQKSHHPGVIKVRSMMSTLKKTSVKTTEWSIDILQDLPSTSKQSQVCDTPQKNRSHRPELIGRKLDIYMTKSVIDGFYMHMWT